MTPELQPLADPLPSRLRWTHAQRRVAWLFDGDACVGSLGFGGYGRASGLTSRGVWHLHRLGVLHLGVNVAPADGRHPPLLMRQSWSFDGTLALPDGVPVTWRTLPGPRQGWAFERTADGQRLLVFTTAAEADLRSDTLVDVCPAAHQIDDPSPLLLLGAFLVRLAVDDSVVVAGGGNSKFEI